VEVGALTIDTQHNLEDPYPDRFSAGAKQSLRL